MEAPTANNTPLSSIVGNAVILLSDWNRFGLEERSLYHFALSEALLDDSTVSVEARYSTSEQILPAECDTTKSPPNKPCGFRYLLECVPRDVRLRSEQRRMLKSDMKAFNASDKRADVVACFQPMRLPLKISPASNIFFAYETVRMAFVLDASPSITGSMNTTTSVSDPACCPLDRIDEMARTFFQSLIKPIRAPIPDNKGYWRPQLAVSVIAVLPRLSGETVPKTILLVRDFRVVDESSAQQLTDTLRLWVYTTVEQEIAQHIARRSARSVLDTGHRSHWSHECTTQLRDLLEAGDAALSSLSSSARPMIIIATDGRGISCDTVISVASDADRVDVPIVVLDLLGDSCSQRHYKPQQATESSCTQECSALDGAFPFGWSDDLETLYGLCRATGGCMFDLPLLVEASKTLAGQVPSESVLLHDQSFSHKRHTMHPNAVQWYTLICLSPMTPLANSHLGRLPAPVHIRLRMQRLEEHAQAKEDRLETKKAVSLSVVSADSRVPEKRKPQPLRSTFATYFVNPVRPQSLLVTRIREGHRVRQYGSTTLDPDKVSIQFVLPVDLGIAVHYELSYRALPGFGNMVGFAHVKIELSGDSDLVLRIKKDYLSPPERHQVIKSATQTVSFALCKRLHEIRRDDTLMSYLSPLKWSDQLLKPDTPFIRRLGALDDYQVERLFRTVAFDVVTSGHAEPSDFASCDGKMLLTRFVSNWATQPVPRGNCFVKKIESGTSNLPLYCLVELVKSRDCLFSVKLMMFAGTAVLKRMQLLASLKQFLENERVKVLGNQVASFLIGPSPSRDHKREVLAMQCSSTSWTLLKDSELIPLLVKRRTGIGGFLLLEYLEGYCLLAKLVPPVSRGSMFDEPGDLVQYEIRATEDQVLVHLRMESEGGEFHIRKRSKNDGDATSRFTKMVENLRRRDQECGRALHCRTNLLQLVDGVTIDDPWPCMKRLLPYAQKFSSLLRCFDSSRCGFANEILHRLTQAALVQDRSGTKVIGLDRAGEDSPVKNQDRFPGSWFLLRHMFDVISMICLSSEDEPRSIGNELSWPCFRLNFYPVHIADLYSRRDDISDDLIQYDTSIPTCVLAFAEHIQRLHELNFSSAAYLACLEDERPSFSEDEMAQILNPLQFMEVCSVVTKGSTKLKELILTKLFHVAKGVYFFKGSKAAVIETDLFDDESDLISTGSSGDTEDESDSCKDDSSGSADLDRSRSKVKNDERDDYLPDAPLFARIYGLGDGNCFSERVTIALSVFDKSYFPQSHREAGQELSAVLHAFVAEQSLERLRQQGLSITNSDLRVVKSCLRRARNVVSCTMNVYFYVGKVDAMVSASAPVGYGREIDDGFQHLVSLLSHQEKPSLVPYSGGGFVVVERETDSEALSYFCFVKVTKSHQILVQVYHPLGPDASQLVLSVMRELILSLCHKTNQILLLKQLHLNRTASELLIKSTADNADDSMSYLKTSDDKTFFPAGAFQCPVIFRHTFPVFYRCANNLELVARTVESAVLHPFTINNNRAYFVYKDESDAIFYMKLETGENDVSLLVYGVVEPCPSVTKQLTALIHKKLLQIAVDMLSTQLSKNSGYNWRAADLDFIKNYDDIWGRLESCGKLSSSKERLYKFDEQEFDPKFLMLFFRQNLCGSTFFHPLRCSESIRTSCESEASAVSALFYFNNAPSKLDPNVQPTSTLTAKGAEYARLAGIGVAIVRCSIVRRDGTAVSAIHYPIKQLCLTESDSPGNLEVRVDVNSSALNREAIHDWIKLTLDQTLRSFTLEQHLARMQSGLAPNVAIIHGGDSAEQSWRRWRAVDSLLPGLPVLQQLLDSDTPHPAILRSVHRGAMRASAVSTVTLQTIEIIVEELLNACEDKSIGTHVMSSLHVIRLSRGRKPQLCRLSRDQDSQKVVVEVGYEGIHTPTRIIDKCTDCPEYICAYVTPELDASKVAWATSVKLFEEVALVGEVKDIVSWTIPSERAFRRSFAFVLSVKRNRRALFAYNWKRSCFKSAVDRLVRGEERIFSQNETIINALQERSLREIAPRTTTITDDRAVERRKDLLADQRKETPIVAAGVNPEIDNNERPSRRAIRPAIIRRPKLIGNSVEGSAAKALTASRQRASSNMFRGGVTAVTPSSKLDAKISVEALPVKTVAKASDGPYPPGLHRETTTQRDGGSFLKASHLVRHHGQDRLRFSLYASRMLSAHHSDIIPFEELNILFSSTPAPVSWSECFNLSLIPVEKSERFLLSFAKALTMSIPDLRISVPSDGKLQSQVLILLGSVKSAHHCRYLVAVRISVEDDRIRSTGKVLAVLGHAAIESNSCRRIREVLACASRSLAISFHRFLPLDRIVFDYFATVSERMIKSPSSVSETSKAVRLIQWLSVQLDLRTQVKRIRGRYHSFPCIIQSSAFKDELVDEYGLTSLFRWLLINSEDQKTASTTVSDTTILLRQEIIVRGTHSLCLISHEMRHAGSIKLLFLCKSDHRNLFEFSFREGSSLGLTVIERITIDGACLVLQELRFAATQLNRERNWKALSQQAEGQPASQTEIQTILELNEVRRLSSVDAGCKNIQTLLATLNDGGYWDRLVQAMEQENSFSPFWIISRRSIMFYWKVCDVFLALKYTDDKVGTVDVICRETLSDTKWSTVIQSLGNFIALFLWDELCQVA